MEREDERVAGRIRMEENVLCRCKRQKMMVDVAEKRRSYEVRSCI
jgi:hypothetical protein